VMGRPIVADSASPGKLRRRASALGVGQEARGVSEKTLASWGRQKLRDGKPSVAFHALLPILHPGRRPVTTAPAHRARDGARRGKELRPTAGQDLGRRHGNRSLAKLIGAKGALLRRRPWPHRGRIAAGQQLGRPPFVDTPRGPLAVARQLARPAWWQVGRVRKRSIQAIRVVRAARPQTTT